MTALATLEPTLSAGEQVRLVELERVIERSYLEVGAALAEIHRDRLYRPASFESYCVDRWKLSRARAYELIRAFEVAEALREAGHEPPSSEGALRPLRPVLARGGPGAVVDAWERVQAAHGGERPPTGPEVRATLAAETPVTPDRGPLDEAGKLLRHLERYVERIGTEPLHEELRPTAARYAGRALALASAFDVLAAGGRTSVPLPADELCIAHDRAPRDGRGVCTVCKRPDLVRPGR